MDFVLSLYQSIFGAGCNSPPAVKPASERTNEAERTVPLREPPMHDPVKLRSRQ